MDDIEVNVTVSTVNFWKALEIYYNHPNSINKQVLLKEDICCVNLQSSMNRCECRGLYEKFHSALSEGCPPCSDRISNYLDFAVMKTECVKDVFTVETGMYLLIRRLIPKLYKNNNIKFYEFIFLDKSYTKAHIFTGTTGSVDYLEAGQSERQDPFVILKFDFVQLTYDVGRVKLTYNKSINEKGINWVKTTFVGKLTKLLVSNGGDEKKLNKLTIENQVDVVDYYELYEKLKRKYARSLIENWTEATDPKKFVYEDIGIAAYLILLWRGGKVSGRKTNRQKFVDLGCGNGLLVHILNSEGHNGVGLDIRRRKIWDAYPSSTVLREETIIPTTDTAYAEADWLIGNHSDELTPWLPIMARRSNRFCQYFVLPCCPYQLNGKKFQRKNSGCSSYQDFIHYVKYISELCDFETHVDKLRIPSTKRISLVGLNHRGMTEEQHAVISKRIGDFVTDECQDRAVNATSLNFTPREVTQPIKNCTKVPYNVREEILTTVMDELLKENVSYTVTKNEQNHVWNRGRRISIGNLAASIDGDLLKRLKSECKGLQTLLKNHHFLFEVSQGCVQFRAPKSMLKISQKVSGCSEESKWKRKICWLFGNHPDGCPLSDDVCSYAHVK